MHTVTHTTHTDTHGQRHSQDAATTRWIFKNIIGFKACRVKRERERVRESESERSKRERERAREEERYYRRESKRE